MSYTVEYFTAGGMNHPGTGMPANVTGDCPHRHRSPDTAQRCIDDANRRLQSHEGTRNAYYDRGVIAHVNGYGKVAVAATDAEWEARPSTGDDLLFNGADAAHEDLWQALNEAGIGGPAIDSSAPMRLRS